MKRETDQHEGYHEERCLVTPAGAFEILGVGICLGRWCANEQDLVSACIFESITVLKLKDLTPNIRSLKSSICTKWTPLGPHEVRLDVNGSVNNGGMATCGGGIRGCNEDWTLGFNGKLGMLPPAIAEVYGILTMDLLYGKFL